jgi:CPA2 family monovalent cation:H+ antiporter-2
VVIVGYGPGGRALSKRLHEGSIPYLILELNAQTVEAERARGVPIYYGDITSREARRHAGVSLAAAVAVQISDSEAAARAIVAIRAGGDTVPIFIRARRAAEAAELRALGADHVACEEDAASAQLIDEIVETLGASGVRE